MDSVLKPTGLYGRLPEFAITCIARKEVELTRDPQFIEEENVSRN